MDRTRRLAIGVVLNALLVVVQIAVALAAHSTALLADAGHNLTDVGALLLSVVAVRMAQRPPSAARSFGHHRATILAALVNSVVVTMVTAVILTLAATRFLHPRSVHAGPVVLVAALGLVVNLVAALILVGHTHDLNVRSAFLHLSGDAASSLVVVAAACVLVVAPSATWLDPAAAVVVAVVIVIQSIGVVRSSVDVLLESTPSGLDLRALLDTMCGVDGVEEIHDLHTWSLSSEVHVLSAHLLVQGHPTLEEARVVSDHVKAAVTGPFGFAHVTLELECEPCAESSPCLMTPSAVGDREGAVDAKAAQTRRSPE